MDLQLQHHKDIVSQIAKKLGSVGKAREHLHKCLYYVNIGSNDYLNNYFQPAFYPTSRMYTPDQYALVLSQQYSTQLQTLHALGARKVVLVGLGAVGCVPYEISFHGNGSLGCVNDENRAILLFNDRVRALVERYNRVFLDAKFIFINSAQTMLDTNQLPGYI
ncbi:SGNH hydrolase superfamily [Sesbania bispinosa]|nr:SGNH hydrolase superfamily [Sesbania bispinosa]